jgi:hypothetical protein
MNVSDLGVSHVNDAPAVSDACARPKFAEAVAADRQVLDQGAHPGIVQIYAGDFAKPIDCDLRRLVPINVEVTRGRR